MQKPNPADFGNEQDYLNAWAGWQVNTGNWSAPVPTDWKAPVVTTPAPVAQTRQQPEGMLTNTNSTQKAVEPPPIKNTSTEDLFANELNLTPNSEAEVIATQVAGQGEEEEEIVDLTSTFDQNLAVLEDVNPLDNTTSLSTSTTQTVPNWKLGDPEPDPSTYRGGSTNAQYLADAGAYNASLMNATKDNNTADPIFVQTTSGLSTNDPNAPQWTGGELGADGLPVNWPRNSYGGAMRYSEMSPAQRAIVDEWRRYQADLQEYKFEGEKADFFEENPDFVITDWTPPAYDSSPEAKQDVLDSHDPNRGDLLGTTVEGYLWDETVGRDWIEKVEFTGAEHQFQLDEPLDLEDVLPAGYTYDADTLYMKLPDGGGSLSMMNGFSTEEIAEYNRLAAEGIFVDISGGDAPAGAHSMLWIKKPEQSTFVQFREATKSMARMVASWVTLGASEAVIAAVKGLQGKTLHTEDWVNIGIQGLNMAGVITAPTDIIDPVTGAVTGQTVGSGLFGLNYGQTVSAIDAIANESVGGLFSSVVPDSMLTGVLQDLGIPSTLASNDDFLGAVRKFNTKLLEGESLEDAGKSAFAQYVKDGGSFGDGIDISGTMFDWSALANLAKPVIDVLKDGVTTITDTLEPLVDASDDVIDWVGDKIDPALQKVGDWIEDNVVDPVDDALDATGDVIDDVIDNVSDTLEDVGDWVEDNVTEPVDDVIDYIGDKLDDAKDSLPHGETPENPLGDLETPDLNVDVNYTEGTPAEFTDDPYEFSEMFKFKTKPQITDYEDFIAYKDLQGNDPFGRTI